MPKPTMTREAIVMLASLDRQRDHVLGILDGLPEEALRRPVLPSGWNCLGLVRHLALDVERLWFREVVAGEQVAGPGQPDGGVVEAWNVGPDVRAEDVFGLYWHEIQLANAIISATPLDAPPADWPAQWPDWRYQDLREIMLHALTETACHAGHLDIVRELIDGKRWLVLS
jgi:hypothetical protein